MDAGHSEIFKIGKTAVATVLKEEKSSQHELFREKSKKRNRPSTYGIRDAVL